MARQFCRKCGAEIHFYANSGNTGFCEKCGHPWTRIEPVPTPQMQPSADSSTAPNKQKRSVKGILITVLVAVIVYLGARGIGYFIASGGLSHSSDAKESTMEADSAERVSRPKKPDTKSDSEVTGSESTSSESTSAIPEDDEWNVADRWNTDGPKDSQLAEEDVAFVNNFFGIYFNSYSLEYNPSLYQNLSLNYTSDSMEAIGEALDAKGWLFTPTDSQQDFQHFNAGFLDGALSGDGRLMNAYYPSPDESDDYLIRMRMVDFPHSSGGFRRSIDFMIWHYNYDKAVSVLESDNLLPDQIYLKFGRPFSTPPVSYFEKMLLYYDEWEKDQFASLFYEHDGRWQISVAASYDPDMFSYIYAGKDNQSVCFHTDVDGLINEFEVSFNVD